MIIHNVDQGGPEWLALRIGIPTASCFDQIITPVRMELSASARTYAIRLITEILLNLPTDSLAKIEHVERGKELEPEAAKAYAFAHDAELQPVGFITSDCGRFGASPDRLIVGRNAALEIKVPAPQTHVGYMLDGFGADYRVQVQGQMLVCGFDYVDRYSWHPGMPDYVERTDRDETFIAKLAAALDAFCDMKDAILAEVRARGFFRERPSILTPAEAAYADQLSEQVPA